MHLLVITFVLSSHLPTLLAKEFRSKILHNASTSYDPPRRTIHEAFVFVHKDDGTAIPNYSSSQRSIQWKRRRKDIPLPAPITHAHADIKIPDELAVTNGGARFLLYDNESIFDNHKNPCSLI